MDSGALLTGKQEAVTRSALFWPFVVWLVHWLLVQIPASLAYLWGTSRADQGEYVFGGVTVTGGASAAYGNVPQWLPQPLDGWGHWLVEPLTLWDGTWYRLVAWLDYGPSYSANAAFFPLYPFMMRWGHEITGLSYEVIGYFISNLAFLGALIILYRLVQCDFTELIARRSLWAIALFPTAFFFSAVYTESLFLLLAVGTLYAARQGHWAIAGLCGLFAALTRNSGVMLLAPLAVLFIQQFGWNPRRWFPAGVFAALPIAGIAIYGRILQNANMGFLAWIDQQWQWNRFSAMPWQTFKCTLFGCTASVRQWGVVQQLPVVSIDWGWIGELLRHPTWTTVTSFEWRDRVANSDVLELVVTIAAFALIIVGARRVPLYYLAFVLPPLLVPLFSPSQVHPLMSMPRFVLPLFPLFVIAILQIRSRRVGWTLAILSSIALILLTMQFSSWYWVS
ncbi:MAG: mannosyltransferase family protein [Thermomicrobiales bacterium]